MEVNLPNLLSSLEGTARRLNESSDSINEILETVESRLVGAGIGIEVWCRTPISSVEGEKGGGSESRWTEQRLGFAKVAGRWSLAVKTLEVEFGLFEGDSSAPYEAKHRKGDISRLLDASRETRIRALSLLEQLAKLLTEEAEEAIKRIKEAKKLTVA